MGTNAITAFTAVAAFGFSVLGFVIGWLRDLERRFSEQGSEQGREIATLKADNRWLKRSDAELYRRIGERRIR